MQKNKISIYEISEKEANEITLKAKIEMDSFWKKHCAKIKDPLTLTIKGHLFIENCINEILEQSIPNPKKLLKNSSFNNKIVLYDALNLCPDKNFTKKLIAINKLRNHYAHNLEKKLSKKKMLEIAKALNIKSKTLTLKEISATLENIIGYLHALKNMGELFPFVFSCQSNYSRFNKDKVFKYCWQIIKKSIPEIKSIISNMKM